MKINDIKNTNRMPITPHTQEREVTQTGKNPFKEVMSDINRGNSYEKLNAMSEDILRQGEVLARRCDISEMKRYKLLLQTFMEEAVRYCYEFNKKPSRDGRGRHHVYAVIKKINEKLEKMTQEILEKSTDAIQLMADIDDINGLLVDLMA